MVKTSQPPKAEPFSGIAWTVRKVGADFQVIELSLVDGTVVLLTPRGEPNLKEIAPPVIEGLVADFVVGGNCA